MNYLETFYSNYDEEGRLLSRHGQVEYITTMKYIHKALAGIPAKAVLLSDGEKGAYLYENGSLCHLPVNGAGFTVKNATGAGDSMIAGYLYGKRTGADPLACAVSAGSATAYCDGIFDKETFDRVLETYEGRI